MSRRSYSTPFILAVVMLSVLVLAAYVLAQNVPETSDTAQPNADQPVMMEPSVGAGAGAGPSEMPAPTTTVPAGEPCPPGTVPAGPGAGPSEAPAGTIVVPEGEPCPPGTIPAGTGAGEMEEQPPVVEEQPPVVEEQPPVVEEQPPVMEEEPPVVEEQPVTPAGPGAGPIEQPMVTRQRPAGYGAGAYYREGYLPGAGLDFRSLTLLGSSLLGAGLMIRRKRR